MPPNPPHTPTLIDHSVQTQHSTTLNQSRQTASCRQPRIPCVEAEKITIRVPQAALQDIDRRAQSRSQTRTAFILSAALHDQFSHTTQEAWADEVDRRLKRLEHATFNIDLIDVDPSLAA
jgi:hypothetical protein